MNWNPWNRLVAVAAILACVPACAGSSDAAPGTSALGDAASSDGTGGDTVSRSRADASKANVALPGPVTCAKPWNPSDPPIEPVIEPQPAVDACPLPAPATAWYASGAPAPTLKLEIGNVDPATGELTAWNDGHEAPIHLGMRTGGGVWTVIRVELPGVTAPTVKLEVETPALIDCAVAGFTLVPNMTFVPVPGMPGHYWNYAVGLPGACVQLPVGAPSAVLKLCGEWMHLVARVHDTTSGAWGEVVRVVRLYGPID